MNVDTSKGKPMRAKLLALLLAAAAAGAQDSRTDSFKSIYRHGHYFLIWGSGRSSPRIKLRCVGFYIYPAALEYQVIDSRSHVLVSDQIARGTSTELKGLPLSRLYLVYANPGLNGVDFGVDRPYGIVADTTRPLGLNKPQGRLFFYVPTGCNRFRVVVQSNSPREGGRVEVCSPDGQRVGEADGELDEPTPIKVQAPESCQGRVWSLRLMKPTAKGLHLDDLNVHLEGELPHLVAPKAEWARDLIPKLPKSK